MDTKLNSMAHVACVKESIANYELRQIITLAQSKGLGLSGGVLKRLYKLGMERLAKYACMVDGDGTYKIKAGIGSETSAPVNN